METTTFYAHSANRSGAWQPAREHLERVAELASGFARPFGAAEEARLAALLHDAGKYSELFQQRLRGKASRLDHWSPGAWLALSEYRSVAAALAIQGHHVGLQRGDKNSLKTLALERLAAAHPLDLALTETHSAALLARLGADGIVPARVAAPLCPGLSESVAAMLDVRMLFSALVDADFLNTEAHFDGPRERGMELDAVRALAIVEREVHALAGGEGVAPEVLALRRDLWDACRDAAEADSRLWTLSAPTGAGKTLAMLGFALRHAVRHSLRRVVVVLPYLSIIDQTAAILRRLLEPELGTGCVVEHHSLAGTRREPEAAGERDAEGEARRRERQLAENWDAPFVVTTSVQLLESLFSNRPSACRKLHRLARSVVLFDEVQTLPIALAVPTLAALAHLTTGRHGATVVFSTATQPAFEHLDAQVRAAGSPGWAPREIAAGSAPLFGRVRRVRVRWPERDRRETWGQVAERLTREERALCIVNLKRHASELVTALGERGAVGVLHLSTAMCPEHRERVLAEVRERLTRREPCLLVSTSCVEAGVDLDFPFGMRALADLTSVAQAAGRVNRNGLLSEAWLEVFVPAVDGRLYAPGCEQAAGVTLGLLEERGAGGLDIDDPALFGAYFRSLYDLSRPGDLRPELREAIRAQDYPAVAGQYRLIDQDHVNVLVPYARSLDLYHELAAEVERDGLTARWIRRARPLTVGIFRPRPDDPVVGYLRPARVARGRESGDWFVYEDASHYDDVLGLMPAPASRSWFA